MAALFSVLPRRQDARRAIGRVCFRSTQFLNAVNGVTLLSRRDWTTKLHVGTHGPPCSFDYTRVQDLLNLAAPGEKTMNIESKNELNRDQSEVAIEQAELEAVAAALPVRSKVRAGADNRFDAGFLHF